MCISAPAVHTTEYFANNTALLLTRFELLPSHPATIDGLTAAYQGPHGFKPDGLCLRHREGHYELGPPCPLALLWKDQHCSTYWLVRPGGDGAATVNDTLGGYLYGEGSVRCYLGALMSLQSSGAGELIKRVLDRNTFMLKVARNSNG
jgi:hypothetical protein